MAPRPVARLGGTLVTIGQAENAVSHPAAPAGAAGFVWAPARRCHKPRGQQLPQSHRGSRMLAALESPISPVQAISKEHALLACG